MFPGGNAAQAGIIAEVGGQRDEVEYVMIVLPFERR
jgi:hypothetical protein